MASLHAITMPGHVLKCNTRGQDGCTTNLFRFLEYHEGTLSCTMRSNQTTGRDPCPTVSRQDRSHGGLPGDRRHASGVPAGRPRPPRQAELRLRRGEVEETRSLPDERQRFRGVASAFAAASASLAEARGEAGFGAGERGAFATAARTEVAADIDRLVAGSADGTGFEVLERVVPRTLSRKARSMRYPSKSQTCIDGSIPALSRQWSHSLELPT